jgi:hypothetical protein
VTVTGFSGSMLYHPPLPDKQPGDLIVTAPVEVNASVRGVLESLEPERLVLRLPGTDYRLRLVPGVPVSQVQVPVGKRVTGTIDAVALRMHPARGGGRFIEPVHGEPRIVAGTVVAVDETNRRVLVDVAVPMWVSWPDGQDTSIFHAGQLVNFYVRSGTRFTPEGDG